MSVGFRFPAPDFFVQIEPGIHGGKLNVGWTTIPSPGVGQAVTVSLLRTWNDPVGTDADLTYLGLDYQGLKTPFAFSVGIYRLLGDQGSDEWLLSVGVGLGWDF